MWAGAYSRKGNREKAIELFTRSQDIGSLINLKAWADTREKSEVYRCSGQRIGIYFQPISESPLLSVKLQEYVRNLRRGVYNFEDWAARDFHDPVWVKYKYVRDSIERTRILQRTQTFCQ